MAGAAGEVPAALAARPELFEDLRPVAEAFALLARGRPVAAGLGEAAPQPIPLSDIKAWLDLFGDPDPEAFVLLVRAADRAWLDAHAERRRRAAARRPAPLQRGRNER